MVKVTVIVLLFATLVAGAFTFKLQTDVESAKQELEEAKRLLAGDQEELVSKESSLELAKANLQTMKAQAETLETQTAAKKELVEKMPALETEVKTLTTQYVAAVQKTRADSVGLAWKDITLPNGQVLTGVTLKTVTDTEVGISHSGGIARIPVEDLPEDLKRRFRYGMFPMQASASPAPGAPKPAAPTPGQVLGAALNEQTQKVQALYAKIAEKQNEVVNLEKTMAKWQESAGTYRALGNSAKAKGRPAGTHFANATAADQQAAIVIAQIERLNSEIRTMQSTVSQSMNRP